MANIYIVEVEDECETGIDAPDAQYDRLQLVKDDIQERIGLIGYKVLKVTRKEA